jgi:chromosomal replication initiator protein
MNEESFCDKDEAVAMDRRATLVMLRHHPELASPEVKQAVKSALTESDRNPEIRVKNILKSTAEKHGLTVNDILCGSRSVVLIHARQEAMYECARLTLLSYPQMSRVFGGRDHSTIMHGIRRHMGRSGAPSVRGLKPIRKGEMR